MSFEQERMFAESLSETPSVLRYSDILKVGTPVADLQYHTLIPSNGSVFNPNQQIRIPFNVPTDSFANLKGAYLRMTINNPSGANAMIIDRSAGVASFIDTWRVVSGTGALLEEIIHYNACVGLMRDLVGATHNSTTGNVMEGTSQLPLIDSLAEAGISEATAVGGTKGWDSIAKSTGKTYSHIPMSGFFQCDRLAPLGFATGTSYVELTLAARNNALTIGNNMTDGGDGWSISQVELVVPVLRMGAEFNASFRQLLSSGIPINWHAQSYHNVQSSIASNTTGNHTVTTSSRKRSVKSVFTMFRKSSDLTEVKAMSNSCRKNLGISSWSYTLGGQRMPSANVELSSTNQGQTYANLIMCLNNLGNTYAATCIDNEGFYNTTDTTGASKIAYGLDLESYGHSDVQSGKNLSGQGLPLVFQAQLGAIDGDLNAAKGADILVDQFLLYDVVYSLDGITGTLSANA